MRFRCRGCVLCFGTGHRPPDTGVGHLVLVRREPGRSCAEPASRPSAPRSGGGAERSALTAASTRARCLLSDEDYQPPFLPTDSAEDPCIPSYRDRRSTPLSRGGDSPTLQETTETPDPGSPAVGVLGSLESVSERWAQRGERAPAEFIKSLLSMPYETSVSELHAPPPVVHMPPTAPAAALLFEHALGGFGEGGNALDAAFLRERIAARPGQHPVGERLLASLGERDERGGAEPEFAAPAADDEPLDPASRPGGLDEQVQAVAVSVSSWRGGTDEGGREGLVGVASSALGSTACGGGFGYNIHSPIIYGIRLDSATRPEPRSP